MKRAGEEKGIKIVWVGFQDKEDKIRAYARGHGLGPVGYDEKNRLSKQLGIRYGAGAVFIDRGGTVRKRIGRGFSEKDFQEGLDKIL